MPDPQHSLKQDLTYNLWSPGCIISPAKVPLDPVGVLAKSVQAYEPVVAASLRPVLVHVSTIVFDAELVTIWKPHWKHEALIESHRVRGRVIPCGS